MRPEYWLKENMVKSGAMLLLSLTGMGAWLVEIMFGSGWSGLAWIERSMASVHIIGILVALCLIVAAPCAGENLAARLVRRLAVIVVLWSATVLSSAFFRAGVFGIYISGGSLFSTLDDSMRVPPVFMVAGSCFLYAISVHAGLRILNSAISRLTALYVLAAEALAVLASYCSVKIFGSVGGEHDFIHSVKMGYPVFWILLLTGFIARWSYLRNAIRNANPIAQCPTGPRSEN